MGQISLFCIFIFKLGSNIDFLHSNSYFDINIGPNISFLHSKSFFQFQNWTDIVFLHSKSYLYIPNCTQYQILIFIFCIFGSNIGFFYIQIPILTSILGQISLFYIQNPIFDFKIVLNIVFFYIFWHPIGTKYRLFSFRILFWHSKLVHKSLALHTKICFDIQNWAKYHFFFLHFWYCN